MAFPSREDFAGVSPYAVFKHEVVGPDHILRVRGKLDIYDAPLFNEALNESQDSARIIVDLTQCRYIDASILSTLVRTHKNFPGQIAIVLKENSLIGRLFQVTDLDKLFSLFPSVDIAKKCAEMLTLGP